MKLCQQIKATSRILFIVLSSGTAIAQAGEIATSYIEVPAGYDAVCRVANLSKTAEDIEFRINDMFDGIRDVQTDRVQADSGKQLIRTPFPGSVNVETLQCTVTAPGNSANWRVSFCLEAPRTNEDPVGTPILCVEGS